MVVHLNQRAGRGRASESSAEAGLEMNQVIGLTARVPFYLRKTSTTTMTTRMSRTAPPPMYMPGTLPGPQQPTPRGGLRCDLYCAPQQVRAPAASMPSLSDAMGEAMLRLQLERG